MYREFHLNCRYFFLSLSLSFGTIKFRVNSIFENERHRSNDVAERNLPGDTRLYRITWRMKQSEGTEEDRRRWRIAAGGGRGGIARGVDGSVRDGTGRDGRGTVGIGD